MYQLVKFWHNNDNSNSHPGDPYEDIKITITDDEE